MKEKKPINLEIGQNVKQIRENAGLTQERLAELIGLGVKHLSAIECGAVGVSLATLKQLCVLLSVPADACKRCVDKQKSEQSDREKARKAEERKAEADERERVSGMRQSKAAMLVKIVVGVLFLFAAVSLAVQGNISSFVCGLVIGGALVAWGLVPYLKAKSGRR